MRKRSKRYQEAKKAVVAENRYSLNDGVSLLMGMKQAKFDETVQISSHLGVDPRQSDQMVRGMVRLPNGSGKKVTVLVFTENAQEALDAGADYAGLDDMIKKVEEGWMDFDVAIATASAMKEVRKLARVLGPRGLMPNPKSGTVTDDIPKGIQEVKAGRVEFKMDKSGNVAVIVGKRSFSKESLIENAKSVIEAINSAKPDAFKGVYLKGLTINSTMSPGVQLNEKEFAKV
ncbi:MAG: 50S ribosomal protein L1 [Verrucomicrobia bacterium]|nr:MAG: 50S ribosomal protein L1 [Verrucomicrobiota bacterium]